MRKRCARARVSSAGAGALTHPLRAIFEEIVPVGHRCNLCSSWNFERRAYACCETRRVWRRKRLQWRAIRLMSRGDRGVTEAAGRR